LICWTAFFVRDVARADRALLAPSSDAPADVVPGGTLSVLVDVATGLTPPPGIQEDRALRMFAITLCADGIDLGGGERRCFPLAVRNLRPLDGSSLRYRVEAPVPVWVAPWLYDLTLRFPGGEVAVARAVLVRDEHDPRYELAPSFERTERAVSLPAGPSAGLVRVHVGASGFTLSAGARFHGFPLPDLNRGFAPGFVALVQARGGEPISMTKRQGGSTFPLSFRLGRAEAGRPVQLSASGPPPDARTFWWLDPARGALGSDVTTVFLLRGQAPLELFAVAPDGRLARAQVVLPIWQRRAFGCALAAPRAASSHAGTSANWFILSAAVLYCARRSRRGPRFAIAAPRA
jgi:hypothetical protein